MRADFTVSVNDDYSATNISLSYFIISVSVERTPRPLHPISGQKIMFGQSVLRLKACESDERKWRVALSFYKKKIYLHNAFEIFFNL